MQVAGCRHGELSNERASASAGASASANASADLKLQFCNLSKLSQLLAGNSLWTSVFSSKVLKTSVYSSQV